MTPRPAIPPGVLDLYASRHAARPPRRLELMALQHRGASVRELLAHLAFGGSVGYDEVVEAGATPGGLADLLSGRDVLWDWVASLARVVALQDHGPEDHDLGLDLYRQVHDAVPLGSLGSWHLKLFGDLLVEANADDEVEALVRVGGEHALAPLERIRLRADLQNPWRAGPFARTVEEWSLEFSMGALLEPSPSLELRGSGPTPFDRLATSSPSPVPSDRLVSVVFPVYRPDSSLWTSVASIAAQTWDELEMVIVDDASGPDHRDLLEQVARSDARIRLVHLPENRGAYGARNLGISLARGEFIAVQDYDDWSHPRRIEHQVARLVADDRLVATRCRAVRVDERLVFAHPGYDPIRPLATSILFRRHEALLGVGWFDHTRKSGDVEYDERLAAHFGGDAIDHLSGEPTLGIVRRLDDSLSRSDFRAGWHHPDRIWYRDSYRRWHERTARDGLFVGPDPGDDRTFTAPRSFRVDRPSDARMDIVVLADWHTPAEARPGLLDWCLAQRAAGARVAIAHEYDLVPRPRLRPALSADVVDRIQAGDLDHLGRHEAGVVGVVVVAQPSVIQFLPHLPTAWEVGRVVLVPEIPGLEPHPPPDDDLVGRARHLFGASASWGTRADVQAVQGAEPGR